MLMFLVGCSQQKEKNDNEYKGEYGTCEIVDTRLIKDSPTLRKEYTQLQCKMKYTNTTNKPRKPIDSLELDMVIESETDIELNEEMNCYIHDTVFISKIMPVINEDFQNSKQVTSSDVNQLTIKEKLKEKFAKIIEYYL